jgi:DUF4097 and DUF4098 domain-containing protein YvlB
VEGVSGTVSAETVNGSITVSGQAREISAESVNGARAGLGREHPHQGGVRQRQRRRARGQRRPRCLHRERPPRSERRRLRARAHWRRCRDPSPSKGRCASGASLEAETVSGSVTLRRCPRTWPPDFSISTFSGSVENALRARRGPRSQRAHAGEGARVLHGRRGASVSVHTLSGGITLRKK